MFKGIYLVREYLSPVRLEESIMQRKVINTEVEYRTAVARLELIFDTKPNTLQGEELESLSLLIDHYEREVSPIDPPDPVDVIRFRMEQTGMQHK